MGLIKSKALNVNIVGKCLSNNWQCVICASFTRTLRNPVPHRSLYLPTHWGGALAWAALPQQGSTFLEMDRSLYRSPLCPGLRPPCLYPAGKWQLLSWPQLLFPFVWKNRRRLIVLSCVLSKHASWKQVCFPQVLTCTSTRVCRDPHLNVFIHSFVSWPLGTRLGSKESRDDNTNSVNTAGATFAVSLCLSGYCWPSFGWAARVQFKDAFGVWSLF